MTAELQLCDAGIIASLKVNNRRLFLETVFKSIEEYGEPSIPNLKDAIYMLIKVWKCVRY